MVSVPWQQVGKCVGLWVLKVVGVATTTFLQQQKESWSYNDTWLRCPRVTLLLLFIIIMESFHGHGQSN